MRCQSSSHWLITAAKCLDTGTTSGRPPGWGVLVALRAVAAGHREARVQRQAARRAADGDRVTAASHAPAVRALVPVGESALVERDRDPLAVAGRQVELAEALQLARRLAGPRREAHIHLRHLGAATCSGVRQLERDRRAGPFRLDAQPGVAEVRVRQAVAEREERLDAGGVEPAVAHLEPLAVEDLAVLPRVLLARALGHVRERARE